MDNLSEVRKHIGKEFRVWPHELPSFEKDGTCILTFAEKNDVTWYIDVELVGREKMKITNIRRKSIIETV